MKGNLGSKKSTIAPTEYTRIILSIQAKQALKRSILFSMRKLGISFWHRFDIEDTYLSLPKDGGRVIFHGSDLDDIAYKLKALAQMPDGKECIRTLLKWSRKVKQPVNINVEGTKIVATVKEVCWRVRYCGELDVFAERIMALQVVLHHRVT